jgi:hypothetical protein
VIPIEILNPRKTPEIHIFSGLKIPGFRSELLLGLGLGLGQNELLTVEVGFEEFYLPVSSSFIFSLVRLPRNLIGFKIGHTTFWLQGKEIVDK